MNPGKYICSECEEEVEPNGEELDTGVAFCPNCGSKFALYDGAGQDE